MKVKQIVLVFFNRTPHNEDVLGECRYSSIHSLTSALDGLCGQLHAPAALPQGKSAWYPLDRRLGGPRAVMNVVVNSKIPSPHRESNPRTPIVQPVA
jgi:hypothetical protein